MATRTAAAPVIEAAAWLHFLSQSPPPNPQLLLEIRNVLPFLSPYPETKLWEADKPVVRWLKVIVIYQLLLSRANMTNGMLSH